MGILYSMMINKMDRDKERYEKICSDRRSAAKSRWDRAKKNDADQCKDEDLQEESMQTMPTATTTATATATSTSTATTTTTTTATAASKEDAAGGDDGDDGEEILSDDLVYLIDRYQLYSDDHEQVVKENFCALSKQYGNDWLSRAIDCAVREGKVNIAYIRGILRNWYKTGRPDESEFRQKQEARPFDNPALNYSQRRDNLNDLLMDL